MSSITLAPNKMGTLHIQNLHAANVKFADSVGATMEVSDALTLGGVKVNNDKDSIKFYKDGANFTITTKINNMDDQPTQDFHATRKDYVDRVLREGIFDEKTRAMASEADIKALLSAEETRAKAAEVLVAGDLKTEVDRAVAAEKELADGILAAKKDASDAAALATNFHNTDSAAIVFLGNDFGAKMAAETSRAVAAEVGLQNKIESETSRAQAKEDALQGSVTTNQNWAVQQFTNTNSKITDVSNELSSHKVSVSKQISDEETRAKNAELVISTALNTEKTRAVAEEEKIWTALDQEKLDRASAVAKEVADRDAAISVAISGVLGDAPAALDTLKEIAEALAHDESAGIALLNKVIASEGQIVTNFNTLNSLITLETGRAQGIEENLDSRITAEVARAKAAEKACSDYTDVETTRAKAAEASLTKALDDEVSRAKGAENNLQSSLLNETTRAQAAETTLTSALAAEVVRAKAVESANASAISEEAATSRANEAKLTAEITLTNKNLTDNVNTLNSTIETGTALIGVAINQVATNLASEINRATKIDSETSTALTAEIARATAAEASLIKDLGNEVNRATAAENDIASSVSTLRATMLLADKANAQAVVDETNRATGAENNLSNALSSEILRAQTSENSIKSSVTAEKDRAMTVESSLSDRIAAEVAARAAGDLAEAAARNTAINTAITALVGGAPAALDTLKEISDQLAKDESVSAALIALIDALTVRVSSTESNKYDKTGGLISGDVMVKGDFECTSKVSAPNFFFGSNWRAIPSGLNDRNLIFQYTPTANDFSKEDSLKSIILSSDDV